MTEILTLTDVSKSFGALKVTDDVSFTVPKGQALGIIGPNGAGKSTLFNLITGNIRPDAGTVTLMGRDVTRLPAMDRVRMGVGRSFQIPQPFEGLTVYENLAVAASFGRGRSEVAVTDDCVAILRDCALLHRANTLAGALSLLDRKRLELARAMATGPDLLLLDEIADGLTEGECKALVATISVTDWTAYVIFIVVIGGIGRIEGPILGVLVFYALQTLLADFGAWYLLTLGLIAIAVILFAPRGLWGLFSDRTGLQLFPVQRRLTGISFKGGQND